jgi:uncharacterized protein YggE
MNLARTLALTVALLLPLAPAVAAEAPPAPRPATLTVNGEGSVAQAPDRATISFHIESIDDQAGRATAQNNTVAAALTDALVRSGIARTAIKTASYSITFNPRPPKPDPNSTQRFGYIVERNAEVTVDRTDTAGAIVDTGVAAGVSGVNGVSFTLRDPQAAYRAALTAALADAQLQARTLAAAAHLRIVRILDIAPAGRLAQPVPLLRTGARLAMSAAVPTELDPGNLTARATVTVRYQVAP